MVLFLIAVLAVLLLVMGLWKRFARETVPTLVNLPGGSWTIGGALGLISVLGAFGALRCSTAAPAGKRPTRVMRAAGTAACCAAAFGPFFYLLGALPGKNCRSYETSCSYLPGTGSAFLAYAVSAGGVAWLLYRLGGARDVTRAARERERMRKLRKKGKGKSRAARGQ
ncbi:hypothetical protein AB0H94_04445 [Streptomyces purpurascens]|uniref:hypothetical protein n=1 Tax=Streptomyces purpurascens TaxID=1924 RepID=UPI00340F1520